MNLVGIKNLIRADAGKFLIGPKTHITGWNERELQAEFFIEENAYFCLNKANVENFRRETFNTLPTIQLNVR